MDGSVTPVSLQPRVEAIGPADFETFFTDVRPRLLGSMILIAASTHEAEEVVQEAFFRVWERWDRVGSMDDPAGYLFRTALNVHRSAYRRAVRAARRSVAGTAGVDPFVTVAERDEVVRALAVMTPRQRAAVVLTELEGWSTVEAASILGIRPGTVRVLISKGRKSLRETTGADDA